MMPWTPHSQSSNLVVARSTRAEDAAFLDLMDEKPHLELVGLLLARLERISADSYWAHRASGVRGALLNILEKIEKKQPVSKQQLDQLIEKGFSILVIAAQESQKVTRSRNG